MYHKLAIFVHHAHGGTHCKSVVSSVMRIIGFFTGSIFIERMLNDVLYAERIGKVAGAYFVAGESCKTVRKCYIERITSK
jgi:hypothetical protein